MVSVPVLSASISLISNTASFVGSEGTVIFSEFGELIASPADGIALGKLGSPAPLKLFLIQSVVLPELVPLGILDAPPTVKIPPSKSLVSTTSLYDISPSSPSLTATLSIISSQGLISINPSTSVSIVSPVLPLKFVTRRIV